MFCYLLLSLCVLFVAINGEDYDDYDFVVDESNGFTLWEEANYCCKLQTTKFGCKNSGDRCLWLSKKKRDERKIIDKFNARCFVRKFVECKKIDIRADCNNNNGEGEWEEPVCNPTYDVFKLTNIDVTDDNKIGEVIIFDEHLEVDITFTTPSMPVQYTHNSLLTVGHAVDQENYPQIALINDGSGNSGNLCVGLSGITQCLGSGFTWNLNQQYQLQLEFAKESYFKIIVQSNGEIYRENIKSHGDSTPSLAIIGPVTLPVYASLAPTSGSGDIADGVRIDNLEIVSYRFEAELEEEDDEEEEILGDIGVWKDNHSKNGFHFELFGMLLIGMVLCGYIIYRKCNGNKYDKYISINDSKSAQSNKVEIA